MNSRCEEFRTLIEQSFSGGLSGEEQVLLEKHLRECDGCRSYLEELESDDILLRGYASLFKDSVSEAGRAVAASLTQDTAALEPPRRNIFMRPKFVLTTAGAVILIAVAVYTISIRTSTPAFARIMEKILKVEDMSYTINYETELTEPFVVQTFVNSEGVMRSESSTGSITVRDFPGGVMLTMNPEKKRAEITHRTEGEYDKEYFNYVDWISTLHNNSAEFKGKEMLNGVETLLYVDEDNPYSTRRVWVDPDSDLPIRIVMVTAPRSDGDYSSRILQLQKSSFGADNEDGRAISFSTNYGITLAMTMTLQEFSWNTDPDTSLFSLHPPEDYTVQEHTFDSSIKGEEDIINALNVWMMLTNGAFPDTIADLSIQEIVEPLLIGAFDGEDDPEEEFNMAMEAANKLAKGYFFVQRMKLTGTWHYSGNSVTLGEKDAPVCWWKEEDSEKYRIIYGDLRVEDIEEKDLPKK